MGRQWIQRGLACAGRAVATRAGGAGFASVEPSPARFYCFVELQRFCCCSTAI
jgi:hypothetical protein